MAPTRGLAPEQGAAEPGGVVCVLGSVNADETIAVAHLPQPGETVLGGDLTRAGGGKGANQAVAAARAGGRVRLIGAVGDDLAGGTLLDELAAEGVDLRWVRRCGLPSGAAHITVDAQGENQIVVAPGANDSTGVDEVAMALKPAPGRPGALDGVDVALVQLETPLGGVTAFCEAARRAGVTTVCNAAPGRPLPDELLDAVDVLVVNQVELLEVAGTPDPDEALGMLAARVPVVVVTLGAAGVRWVTGGEVHHQPAFEIDPVDTVGAGDAFCGVLATVLTEGDLDQAIRRGAAAGALAACVPGARCGPLRADLDAFEEVEGFLGARWVNRGNEQPDSGGVGSRVTTRDDATSGTSLDPRPTVILDCDPGHDDAIAILLASRHSHLVGITTVAGNASLADTTRNALLLCELFGLDVPVHAGCDRPLLAVGHTAAHIHGANGLGGPDLPEVTRTPATGHGVVALLELTHSNPGCWIVAVGPLTNVALALRLDPTLGERVAGISVMGGGIGFGNVTPSAEFNFWHDPEAAAIVLGSGLPVRMCGLDLTHQVRVTLDDAARLATLPDPGGFVADLMRFFAERYRDVYGGRAAGPLHDPCAVLAVTHPEVFGFDELEVTVETQGPQRGMSIADLRGLASTASAVTSAPRVAVARRVEAAAAHSLILEAVEQAVRSAPER